MNGYVFHRVIPPNYIPVVYFPIPHQAVIPYEDCGKVEQEQTAGFNNPDHHRQKGPSIYSQVDKEAKPPTLLFGEVLLSELGHGLVKYLDVVDAVLLGAF